MNLKNKRILVIAPHPDDEMICAGGLIAKATRESSEVFVLYMAVGSCRQLVTGKTDEKTRIEETVKVSEFLNFKFKFQFVGDEFMKLDSLPQKSLIDPIEDTIQAFKPEIVVIPYQHSFDQDHRAVFLSALTALRPIPKEIRHFVKTVLEWEEPCSWGTGPAFKPNFYVALDEELLNLKLKGLSFHKSQLRDEPFTRSPENLTRLAKLRGGEIGRAYAEAYVMRRGVIE